MLMVLLMFACDLFGPAGPQPEIIVVVRGDTLGELAKAHGVTVAQLKEWNGLSSDLIEVGQELKVFRDGEPAAAPAPKRRRGRRGKRAAPVEGGTSETSGPRVPDLPIPAAKRCLSGPDGSGMGDEGMAASQGLDAAQVQRAMNAFLPKVGTCLVDLDPRPSMPLDLAITVGCDGRVTNVTIRNGGDWPSAHASCLTQALERAPFPAHALPDGDTFHYPLTMQ